MKDEDERVRSENVLKRHESLMHMMVQQQQQAANFQAVMAQQNQSLMTLMSQIMKKLLMFKQIVSSYRVL